MLLGLPGLRSQFSANRSTAAWRFIDDRSRYTRSLLADDAAIPEAIHAIVESF